MNSSLKAFLSNSLVVLSLLRSSRHPVRGSFIPVLPWNCCLRPRYLTPFLHSGHFHSLSPSFRGSSFCLIPGRILPDDIFPAPCRCFTVGRLPAGNGQPLPRSTISLGPNFPENLPFSLCHCCTTGHLSACGSQLPPGSTISSVQSFWLSVSPCSFMLARVPLLHRSRRFHYCLFLGDLLMLRYCLNFWIGLSLLCICLRRFLGGPLSRFDMPSGSELRPFR
jgi:hypothetical protein